MAPNLALNGGGWSPSKPPEILPLWTDLPVFTRYEAEWVSEPFWKPSMKKKFLAPARN
jgi:hypothetical protein